MEVRKAKAMFDFDGVITGSDVVSSVKKYKDAMSFYKTTDESLDEDTIMYRVYQYTQGEGKSGNLNWGLTVMEPVRVAGECNITRGHWHDNRDCAEFYMGVAGKGLLMYMDDEGNTWAEEVTKGSLHHIDGRLAHRLINTGEEVFKVACCWPCDAGHDYAAVEAQPFGYRVMKKDKELTFEKTEVTR